VGFFEFLFKTAAINVGAHGCYDRRNLEPRTACLGCLHARSQKALVDPESECEQSKGQLEIDQSITHDNYYRCAIRSAIFYGGVAS